MHNGPQADSGSPYPRGGYRLSLKEALPRKAAVHGGDDDADNTDIEDGDGQGGSGSPGH
ncbi:hypothetical protein GCM10010387_13330 [Streptomyces inusitatus]|uniref:Uncharacterized protein n=1 Tax=Streptomyces inusitatus TaxID=68221 RepID=A0A918PSN0_9ACTN|nr:hypothetical protein GCM10010387_13330 [Streptomyces inusitatus]